MNYTTYYSRGQKVFLINLTPERDETVFDAFSATIVACDNHHFELRPRYKLFRGDAGGLQPGMQYKVTAESLGNGVQFNGTITAVADNSFTLKPTGLIEMYQRSQVPRMDLVVPYRIFTKNAPLDVFRREWQQLSAGLTSASSSDLELTSGQINLGIGGIRYLADTAEQQTELALVFVELEPGKPPLCAVAEQLWRRTLPDEGGLAIGRRFVLIRKADQDRLRQFIQLHHKKKGQRPKPRKNNWELLDRMLYPQNFND